MVLLGVGRTAIDKDGTRVIHREDYHRVLLDAAKSQRVEIRLGADVKDVNFEKSQVILTSGEVINATVIVGADGSFAISHKACPILYHLHTSQFDIRFERL